jgi:hypothetical protein
MGNFYSKNDVSEQTYPTDNTLITLNKVTTYDPTGEANGSESFVSGRNYYLAYQISKNGTKKATPLIINPTSFQMLPPPNFDVTSFDIRLKKKNDFNFSIVLRNVVYSSSYYNGKKLNCYFVVEYYDTATSSSMIGFNDSRYMSISSTNNVDLQQTNFWNVSIPSNITGNKYMDIYVHIYDSDVHTPFITKKTSRIPLLVTVDPDLKILQTGIDVFNAHRYSVRTRYNNPYYETVHIGLRRWVNWFQTSTSVSVINQNISYSLLNTSNFTEPTLQWTNYLPTSGNNVRGLYYEINFDIRDVLSTGGWPPSSAGLPTRNPNILKTSQRFRHLG